MIVHAAFGGSTNLLLHIPAIAHAAGLPRPTVEDWIDSQSPNAAAGRCAAQRPGRPSHRARLPGRRRAGGHAASAPAGLLDDIVPDRRRASRWAPCSIGGSEANAASACASVSPRRRRRSRRRHYEPRPGRARGLTSTVTFPRGNLAPEGSVIKSTAIDPSVVDADGVYRMTGPRASSRASGPPSPPSRAGRRPRFSPAMFWS